MRGIRDKRTFFFFFKFFILSTLILFHFIPVWFGCVHNIYDGDILFYEGLLVCVCPL